MFASSSHLRSVSATPAPPAAAKKAAPVPPPAAAKKAIAKDDDDDDEDEEPKGLFGGLFGTRCVLDGLSGPEIRCTA